MKQILVILVAFFCVQASWAQKKFVKNLKKGETQTVVVYGASVAALNSDKGWVEGLRLELERKYPGQIRFYNISKSGENSYWATENFKDSVLSKSPDLLIFGFCENDCVERFNYQPWYSGRCAEYMINRLEQKNKNAEVIMYIMSEKAIGNRAGTRSRIAAFNDSYRETAKKNNVPLADFSSTFMQIYENGGESALKLYQNDGILPSRKAAKEILIPGFVEILGL